MHSVHWAVSVTTSLGVPVKADTAMQSMYESFVVCLGVSLQAYVFGAVASAVGQLDEGARVSVDNISFTNTFSNVIGDKNDEIFLKTEQTWNTKTL